jgi:ribosomal protein S18 acetylase RimI-like enzyme
MPLMNDVKILKANATDIDACIATQVIAFAADPFIRWLFPSATEYFRHFDPLARMYGGRAFENESAYRTVDADGCAMWLPPGVHPDEEGMGALMESVLPMERHADVFGFFEQLGAAHPTVEHWHLAVIGVDAHRQGEGYGSALLATSLAEVDRRHTAAYLESSNPKNIPLYRRFGFEVVGELQSGSSPVVYPMFRAAR